VEARPGYGGKSTSNVPYHVHLFRVSLRRGFEDILQHTKSVLPPHLAWTLYIGALLRNVQSSIREKMVAYISKAGNYTTANNSPVPRQVAAEDNYFKYSPLPSDIPNPIRLVVLLPQTYGTGIRCLLTVESLDNSPEYEALSYAWGDASDRREIEVNGKILSVTSNLATALHYLRLEPKGNMYGSSKLDEQRIFRQIEIKVPRGNEPSPRALVLWIDALCIDQTNISEKNDQIRRMDVIYKKAERVICWLGPRSNTSSRALEIMRTWFSTRYKSGFDMGEDDPFDSSYIETAEYEVEEPTTKWISQVIRSLKMDDLDALVLLFERAWWARVWIIQEIALARTAIAMIGDEIIPFEYLVEHFARGLRWAIAKSSVSSVTTDEDIGHSYDEHTTTSFGSPFWDEFSYRHKMAKRRRALFDAIRRPQMMQNFSSYIKNGVQPPLAELISLSRHQNATDPRDKIFALLGLLSSHHPCFGLVEPDYTLSPSRLYTRFSKRYIERFGTLDMLGLAGDGDLDSHIPTWVPDWRVMPMDAALPFADITSRPSFVVDIKNMPPIVPFYAATLDTKPPVPFEFLFNEQVMGLIGIEVDRIAEFGDACPLESSLEPLRIIKSWKAIAGLTEECLDDVEKQDTRVSVDRKTSVNIPAANAEAFWRTVLADDVLIRTHRTGEYRKRLGSKIERISSIPPSSKEEESWLLHYLACDALTLGMRHCANRRFFRTTRGYIGLGPRRMVLGDVVAVVYGGRVPLILRQTLDFYSLVGERCVHDPVEFKVALSYPVLIPYQLCSWHYGWRNHLSGTRRSAQAEKILVDLKNPQPPDCGSHPIRCGYMSSS
jgi:hypothetical protein